MNKWISVLAIIAVACGGFVAIVSWAVFAKAAYPRFDVLFTTGLAVLSSVLVLSFLVISGLKKEIYRFGQQLDKELRMESDNHSTSKRQTGFLQALMPGIKGFISNFKETATEVVNTSDCVAIGSAEVSYFLDKLTNTIDESARQTTQISVAAEEITQTTGAISDTMNSVSMTVGDARAYSDEALVPWGVLTRKSTNQK